MPDYPMDEAPTTPEYVFSLIRDYPLLHSPIGPSVTYEAVADEPVEPSYIHLHDVFVYHYGLDLPSEFIREFGRLDRYTVRQLCEAVAAAIVTRPVIRPWRFIGGESLTAGAFLSVRSMLAERGADAERIAPSTPLSRYLLWYGPSLEAWLGKLAPGRLPEVTSGTGLRGVVYMLSPPLLIFLLALLSSWGLRVPVPRFMGDMVLYSTVPVMIAGAWIGFRDLIFRRYMGDLNTFRDLAYVLAGEQPRRTGLA